MVLGIIKKLNTSQAKVKPPRKVVLEIPPGLNEKILKKRIERLIEREKRMKELFGILKTKKSWDELEGSFYGQASA